MIGHTLSHYEITAKLGSGAMGVVYRAEDTKLGRDVALKLLPEEMAADPERLERFKREAQAIAALNHPNIVTIYSVEEAAGLHLLTMELVEGRSLDELLPATGFDLDTLLALGAQIADGLAAAHEKGITHRDLKPANVMVTEGGRVKILDFGLAKLAEAEPDNAKTALLTQEGTFLGTPFYMSPEQAQGQTVDARSDVFSLGVLLYEMATGERPFQGGNPASVISAVLRDQPPGVTDLRTSLPRHLGRIVRRCLEKKPERRYQSARDVQLEIEGLKEEQTAVRITPERPASDTDDEIARAVESRVVPGSGWRERTSRVVAALALAVAAALWWQAEPGDTLPEATHFAVTMGTGQTLSIFDQPILALSPDGRKLAFAATDPESGRSMIHLRMLDQLEARAIPGTEDATHPFFSPDGESLAFFADRQLKKVPLNLEGSILALAAAPNPRGGVWGSNGFILFAPGYDVPLARVSANGGPTEEVLAPDPDKGERSYRWPELLPGSRVAIFTVGTVGSPNSYDDALIVAHDLETGERHVLVDGGNMARFLPPDKLVYSLAGRLFVVPFDPRKLQVLGAARAVVDGIAGDPSSGAAFFAVAANGTLAFTPGTAALSESYLTLLDRQGEATRLPLSPRGFQTPRFSPDGTQIAFGVGEGSAGVGGDVWTYSLGPGAPGRVTFDQASNRYPVWTPDGSRITFSREPGQLAADASADSHGIYIAAADGGGSLQRLIDYPDGAVPTDWSPDEGTLAFTSIGISDILLLTAEEETATLFEADASSPDFSPNGKWLAYTSPASGNTHIFVRPVEGEAKWQASPGQGAYPRWSGDGRGLYYIDTSSPDRPLMVVEIKDPRAFSAGPAHVLLPSLAHFTTATAPLVNWDVSPDGQTFVFVEPARDETERSRIEVILNWAGQLDSGGP